ncbi:26S proteasome non-ATPase regulatory subunit 9-like [Limulus polyphemus]|uniref:26S proteasome non-ATPase regulatory subunit 9-like n=1 Tax=Limulus polyphemus TaxID=6850 RepID=A0ABM1BLQ4_LIMPO|nr:26S proteasome non-ATPase regulatory subunit 9-like [Limulus polyphemus]XP_013784542.1 26S proteasome non-ATPase regulatory subunit 9-like [Limulus polyphemus]
MEESLIDKDDYPRGDIDVYKVRSARQQIICLQNDHKTLMKEIEEGLFSLHAKEKVGQKTTEKAEDLDNFQDMSQLKPFVKIDRVDTGSPSHTAELQVGDLVIRFGTITKSNFRNIKDISELVQNSIGKPIVVEVIRDSKLLSLSLKPQSWSGRGFLGCNIVPVIQ